MQGGILQLNILPPAPPVAVTGRLDFQDIRAQIGQISRAQRAGPAHGEIGDPNTRQWRGAGSRERRTCPSIELETEWRGRRPHTARTDGREGCAPPPVRVIWQVSGFRGRRDRNAQPISGVDPIGARPFGEEGDQSFVDDVGADHAFGRGGQIFRLGQVGAFDQGAKRRPLGRRHAGHADEAVSGCIGAAGIDRRKPVHAAARRGKQRIRKCGHPRRLGQAQEPFQCIDIDLRWPVRFGHQRGQAGDEPIHARKHLWDMTLRQGRRSVDRAEAEGQAADGVHQGVVTGPSRIGAILPEPGHPQTYALERCGGEGGVGGVDLGGRLAGDDKFSPAL